MFCCFSYLLGHEKHIQNEILQKKIFLGKFGAKVMILDFQSQNGTQTQNFDETLL